MSRIPELTGCPSISSISFAIRSAIGTPRLRMPTMMRSSVPRFFSRISMAKRRIARFMRGPSSSRFLTFIRTLSTVRFSSFRKRREDSTRRTAKAFRRSDCGAAGPERLPFIGRDLERSLEDTLLAGLLHVDVHGFVRGERERLRGRGVDDEIVDRHLDVQRRLAF